ncbi:L-aspartate oxidase [Poriferisphaera sp. WC338]|uniref:L-aspartate oxidase n=1 Tax=Poriferisphaera sp. WC338 TaxID=3425129 RepID=UPI003D81593F
MENIFRKRRYLIPFRAVLLPQIFTDVLVIGGGVAGMRAALAADQHGEGVDIILTTKGTLKDSSTYYAQGGVAAVLAEDDTFDNHIADTHTAGAGLCDAPAVRTIIENAPEHIDQLIKWGMPFDILSSNSDGKTDQNVALGIEGGHSHRRILHADGDGTGKALAHTLHNQILENDSIRTFDNCFVLDLITDPDQQQCLGAITHHPRFGLQVIWAASTIVASGGCGQVYRETTNPAAATGDGIAAAYRAGAQLMDMPFMQFHPTTLYIAGAARSLISEAVRGEGAYLIDKNGHRFMPDIDPRAELAPRDIVSRAIIDQMAKTHHTHVYLDVRHLGDRFATRFPGIDRVLKSFGISATENPIPVHPSAHYMIGGIKTDLHGRTTLQGLYAAGEATCTGLHGANRLASNSLLEGLVMGARAGEAALESTLNPTRPSLKIVSDIRISDRAPLDLDDVRSSLRSTMWRNVAIQRTGPDLREVLNNINFWAHYTLDKIFDDRTGWETQNLLTLSALITQAALWREESRGTHHRTDFSQSTKQFHCHDLWSTDNDDPITSPIQTT